MAEEIVSCPGCGKKFRIPEGAEPGTFDCTACNASVPHGQAATATKTGKKRGGSRGARRAKGRRASAAEETDRPGREAPAKKESKTPIIVTAVIGALVVIVLVAMRLTREEPPKTTGTDADKDALKFGGLSSAGGDPVKVAPKEVKPVAPVVVDNTEPDEPSGIGDATDKSDKPDRPQYQDLFLDREQLFRRHENYKGVTDEERAEIDRLVGLMIDLDSGRAGVRALDQVQDIGIKAFPSLISTFAGQTWESEEEQRAAHSVQQLLWHIIKADKSEMPSELFARFNPTDLVSKEHFDRAARMWISMWLSNFRYKDEFTPFPDSD